MILCLVFSIFHFRNIRVTSVSIVCASLFWKYKTIAKFVWIMYTNPIISTYNVHSLLSLKNRFLMAFWCIVNSLALKCRGRNIPREQGRCFALAPCVFRSSVAIVLTAKGKWFLTFYEFQLSIGISIVLEFQLPLPYQGHGKCKYDFIFPQINSACKKDYWPKHITIMTHVWYWISATLKIAILLVVNSNVNTLHPRNYVDGWIVHVDVIKCKHSRRY